MPNDRPLPLAAVFSIEGETLSEAEKTLFSASQPFGFILFGRNCKSPKQVERLTDQLRQTVGWDCPVMIDQEGGRVARLKPPQWDAYQSAHSYGQRIDADMNDGLDRLSRDMTDMAKSLTEIGIDVNCAPVLDLLFAETHAAIGDRAYGSSVATVVAAADATCKSFLDAGVTPVIKHIPGHGRAIVDSHLHLPEVTASFAELNATDFETFRQIAQKPYAASLWAMAAHVVYSDIDKERPASISPIIINDIIRKEIGFDGLLFSDDLDMKALEKYGSIAERARESLQAGCDLALYCWAKLDVMEQLAATLPPLSAKAWQRWENSLDARWAA